MKKQMSKEKRIQYNTEKKHKHEKTHATRWWNKMGMLTKT